MTNNTPAPADLVGKVGMALCEHALGGKRCTCKETGKFRCADAYPGQQAQAAITAMQAYMASDGVTQMDWDVAKEAWEKAALADLYHDPRNIGPEFGDDPKGPVSVLAQAFAAQRRAAAITPQPDPCDMEILTWLAKRGDLELRCDAWEAPEEWIVHQVTGARSDREWQEIAREPSPIEALHQARAALAKSEGQ